MHLTEPRLAACRFGLLPGTDGFAYSHALIRSSSRSSDTSERKRSSLCRPLSTFLDLIASEHAIENAMLLLEGSPSGRDIDESIEQCRPVGMFEESTMRSVPTFENSSKGYSDLCQAVLVNARQRPSTPLGRSW